MAVPKYITQYIEEGRIKDWGIEFRRSYTFSVRTELFFRIDETTNWGFRREGESNYITSSGVRFSDMGLMKVFSYGASRHMRETGLQSSEEEDATATLFDDTLALPNAEEWLLQADYAFKSAQGETKQRAKKRRDDVKAVLLGLLPEVDDLRFTKPDETSMTPRVEFKTPYGWVKLPQLGLGYRTMIAWTVDLARRLFARYPNSPNPLAEPAVVLVDEIDLHLHPRWQRQLQSFLCERFPNTQFIVTAHSPLVVQAAANANIAVLRREGDHVVIDNDVESIAHWRVDQILTSELFDLPSARPPHQDDLLAERQKLLAKSKLTKKDRARLDELSEKLGDLSAGETPEEIEAMRIIREAAEQIKAHS